MLKVTINRDRRNQRGSFNPEDRQDHVQIIISHLRADNHSYANIIWLHVNVYIYVQWKASPDQGQISW